MYDHNQTIVPDSFLAFYSAHGRPLLSRPALEARHELCEDIALQTAAFLAAHGEDAEGSARALKRCHEGLLAEPAAFSAAEAGWIVARVAELQEWPQPEWLAAARAASP